MSVEVKSTVVLTDSGGQTLTIAHRDGWENDPEPFTVVTASGSGVKASRQDLLDLAAAIPEVTGSDS